MSVQMSRPLHRVCAFASVLLLAGCASTRGLKPEDHAMDAAQLHAQRSLANVIITPAAWPHSDWWKTLGDPQLDALVDEALAGNPDLAMAEARARKAEAQANAADAARKPELTGSTSESGARLPQTLIPEPFGGHFATVKYGYLSFKWGLDLWGGKRAAWEAAVGAARAGEIDAQAARLMLSADVVRAYVALADAYRQRDLAGAELQRTDDFLKLTKQRVAAGIDSQFQLAQISGETASAKAQLSAAGYGVSSAGIALAVLLGRGPDRALGIPRPKPLPADALALPSALPAELLGRRPDVVAARWRVQVASADIKVAKTEFLPNISLGALAGLAAGGGTNLFQAPARFYEVAPVLSLPIFDGGRLRANLAGKDADYDLAVAQYDKTLIGAINQVAERVDAVRAFDAQLVDDHNAVDSARHAYDLAMLRYHGGVGNYLEALSVRQQLIVVERQLAALQTQRADASVQLVEALGGGFVPAADTPAIAATHL